MDVSCLACHCLAPKRVGCCRKYRGRIRVESWWNVFWVKVSRLSWIIAQHELFFTMSTGEFEFIELLLLWWWRCFNQQKFLKYCFVRFATHRLGESRGPAYGTVNWMDSVTGALKAARSFSQVHSYSLVSCPGTAGYLITVPFWVWCFCAQLPVFIETFEKEEMQLILNAVLCSKGRNALKLNRSLRLKDSVVLWCLCKLHVCDLQLSNV